MCGEIESEASLDHRIVGQFRELAQSYLDRAAGAGDDQGAAHVYMDRLFSVVLRTCVQDLEDAGDGVSLDQLRAQAIVLARLSGLLASQLPVEIEALPAAMDAMLVGYRETEPAPDHGHHHHH